MKIGDIVYYKDNMAVIVDIKDNAFVLYIGKYINCPSCGKELSSNILVLPFDSNEIVTFFEQLKNKN